MIKGPENLPSMWMFWHLMTEAVSSGSAALQLPFFLSTIDPRDERCEPKVSYLAVMPRPSTGV